jgi:hypothetical protein
MSSITITDVRGRVRISTNNGRIRLGAYASLDDAIKVRENAEREYGYLGYGGKQNV